MAIDWSGLHLHSDSSAPLGGIRTRGERPTQHRNRCASGHGTVDLDSKPRRLLFFDEHMMAGDAARAELTHTPCPESPPQPAQADIHPRQGK